MCFINITRAVINIKVLRSCYTYVALSHYCVARVSLVSLVSVTRTCVTRILDR